MTVAEIQERVKNYAASGKKIFISSSFQTHSIPLLHILSRSGVAIDVVFLNTGFHFPETLIFKDQIVELLGLNLIEARSSIPKIQQRDIDGNFHFISDPDYCCHLNKVQPLEPFLMQYDVWITGVRTEQSSARKAMKTEQLAPFGTLRFHPLLGWTAKDIWDYRKEHDLPDHPLDKFGFVSIGCAPCTRKFDMTDERSARWFGLNKTECGLHKDLIK